MLVNIMPPSTTNEWTQTQMIDDHHHHKTKATSSSSTMASSSATARVMEKPGEEHVQQQQQGLKCPRCDSSNTKFCYYNNYSLSQPRHFCKACKRYWTRGGTLRNVPVGGGCRKNTKRLKRQSSSSIDATPSPSPSSSSTHPPTSNINPLFYDNNNKNNNSCDLLNLPSFPAFGVSSAYDNNVQPHLSPLTGLGFSSGIMSNNIEATGFGSNNSNSFLSAYNSIFGSCSSSASTTPSTLLSSTLLQHKFINGGGFQGMATPEVEVMQMRERGEGERGGVMGCSSSNEERGRERLEWQNQMMEHTMGFSDASSSLYWSTSSSAMAASSWNDQPNIGPSVTSLI